jgi:predicted ATPase
VRSAITRGMLGAVVSCTGELIGRDEALAALVERLRERRLVTVVGPGGIGKTALARVAATHVEASFERGCHVVDLTRATTADEVEGAVAAQLGFQTFQVLLDTPVELPILLLVDNCEHVTSAAADVVARVLDACTAPTVLATSRSPLDVPGEVVIPIGPLDTPPRGVDNADAAAVRLFLARATDAGATLVDGDIEAVCELCRRLDGVPLAIEIAAARARSMSPWEILARLDEQLDLLSRPRWRGSSRHRSLRSTIEWSYLMLDQRARALFDHLGVFSGPFSAEMAHHVAGAAGDEFSRTLELLDELVSASLVMTEREGPVTWYRLLEAPRAYAFEELRRRGDLEATSERLAEAAATSALTVIEGSRHWQGAFVARATAAHENLVTALRWCLTNDTDGRRALLLTAALWETVHQAHTEEVADLGAQVLTRWPLPTFPHWHAAAATTATALLLVGRHDEAIACARRAISSASPRTSVAPALLEGAAALARLATGDGDTRPAFARAAALARSSGAEAIAVELEIHYTEAAAAAGCYEDALAQLELCAEDARRLGSVHLEVYARTVAGQVRLRLGSETAGEVIEQALADARRTGYAAAVLVNLCALSAERVMTGRPDEGARAALEVLDQLSLSGIGSLVRIGLEAAAAVLRHLGRPAWVDVAATARSLPPCGGVAGPPPEILPECRGQRLVVRDAVAIARRELREALARTRNGDDAAVPAAADRGAVFRRSGDHWEIAFENRNVHLVDSKGMNDLAVLIAQPGHEVHCVELAGAAVEQPSTGEVIDASARRAYEARVRELQAELDQAEAEHDLGRAELARRELDALVDQLTTAFGLARHARRSAGTPERARTAVTQRIRSAIRRIADAHPTLGQHLQRSVRTGAYCCYDPERPVDWVVVPYPAPAANSATKERRG